MSPEYEKNLNPAFGSDKRESEPKLKHTIHIENAVTEETEQRKKWLIEMFPMHHRENSEIKKDTKIEYAHDLGTWKQEVPFVKEETIDKLRNYYQEETSGATPNPKFIPHAIYDAYDKRNQEQLRAFQELGKGLVSRYGGRDQNKQWQDLPEEHKRYARLGELTIFMVDGLNALRTLKEKTASLDDTRNLNNMLISYTESTDLPPAFDKLLVDPLAYKFSEILPDQPEAQESLTPWDAGTLHDLYGNDEIVEADAKDDNEIVEPIDDEEINQNFKKITGPENRIDPDEANTIDMKLNSVTGHYEPAETAFDGTSQITPSDLGEATPTDN